MKINIEIPDYTPENKIQMGRYFLNLAQDEVPAGCNLHLDEFNSPDEGSIELIIEINN